MIKKNEARDQTHGTTVGTGAGWWLGNMLKLRPRNSSQALRCLWTRFYRWSTAPNQWISSCLATWRKPPPDV